jgi:hypothetical protein
MTQSTIMTTRKNKMCKTIKPFWINAHTGAPQMFTMKRTNTMAKTNRVPCQAVGS